MIWSFAWSSTARRTSSAVAANSRTIPAPWDCSYAAPGLAQRLTGENASRSRQTSKPARRWPVRFCSQGTISNSPDLFVNPKPSSVSNRGIVRLAFPIEYHNSPVDIFFDSCKKTLAFVFPAGVGSTPVQGLRTLQPFLDGERGAQFSVGLVEHSHRSCSLAIWGSMREPLGRLSSHHSPFSKRTTP